MAAPDTLALLVPAAALMGVASVATWWARPRRRTGLFLLACALVAGTATAIGHQHHAWPVDGLGAVAVVALLTLVAVAGGGPLTSSVFVMVDRPSSDSPGVSDAGDVLRGGAWIGALERLAVFASLLCSWPEGLALTLAVKGLGRYPELRNDSRTGIAERFLIGTFVSVLWAAAWAGMALVLVH